MAGFTVVLAGSAFGEVEAFTVDFGSAGAADGLAGAADGLAGAAGLSGSAGAVGSGATGCALNPFSCNTYNT